MRSLRLIAFIALIVSFLIAPSSSPHLLHSTPSLVFNPAESTSYGMAFLKWPDHHSPRDHSADTPDSDDHLEQSEAMPTTFPGIETLSGPIPPRHDYVPNLATILVEQHHINRVITEEGRLRYVATIPLRRDLFWSDGRQFSAEDVAYSYELARSKEHTFPLQAASAESVQIIQSALDRVEIIDDTTVKIVLYWMPTVEEWRDGVMGLPIIQRAEWESFYNQPGDIGDPALGRMLRHMATIGGDHRYNHRRFETVVLFKNGAIAISNPASGYSYVSGNAGGEVELIFERN